ncbi:hypothetical protein FRB90_000906, partial [Tulasnella sp. 427]
MLDPSVPFRDTTHNPHLPEIPGFATVLRVFGRPPSTNTVHHIIRGAPGTQGSGATAKAGTPDGQQQPGHRVYEGELHQHMLHHHNGHAHVHH